jgi:hypothetical protein
MQSRLAVDAEVCFFDQVAALVEFVPNARVAILVQRRLAVDANKSDFDQVAALVEFVPNARVPLLVQRRFALDAEIGRSITLFRSSNFCRTLA